MSRPSWQCHLPLSRSRSKNEAILTCGQPLTGRGRLAIMAARAVCVTCLRRRGGFVAASARGTTVQISTHISAASRAGRPGRLTPLMSLASLALVGVALLLAACGGAAAPSAADLLKTARQKLD